MCEKDVIDVDLDSCVFYAINVPGSTIKIVMSFKNDVSLLQLSGTSKILAVWPFDEVGESSCFYLRVPYYFDKDPSTWTYCFDPNDKIIFPPLPNFVIDSHIYLPMRLAAVDENVDTPKIVFKTGDRLVVCT